MLQHVVSHHRRLQSETPYGASTLFSCSSEQIECLGIMIDTVLTVFHCFIYCVLWKYSFSFTLLLCM